MSFDVEQHVLYRIGNAPVQPFPYPHFYVRDVFPEAFYRELLERLPAIEAYQRLDETGSVPKGSYPERFVCDLDGLEEEESARGTFFWGGLSSWIMSERFSEAIMSKFQNDVTVRFGQEVFLRTDCDVRLVRDFTNYSIAPHTDTPAKLVSLLFYLPADDSLVHRGTAIYVPMDKDFQDDSGKHHSFKKFKKMALMEYRPNSLFAFFKTSSSFHGVEPVAEPGAQRNSMLYNIYVKKVVSKGPAKPRFSWLK
jgi:hypothetical protein